MPLTTYALEGMMLVWDIDLFDEHLTELETEGGI